MSFEKLSSPVEKMVETKEEYWFNGAKTEEEIERKEREKNNLQNSCVTSLSSMYVSFSDDKNIKREDNKIISENNNGWQSCLIMYPMSCGIYRISLIGGGKYLIGLTHSSQRLNSDGGNIVENHIGL